MTLTFRRGTLDDGEAAYAVLVEAFADQDRRRGIAEADNTWCDPAKVAEHWARFRPFSEHVASTAEQYWVAERDDEIIGFARAILYDGMRELTEFFVLPDHQDAGVGRELLARAFPSEGVRRRSVIASGDLRALVRYLKAGVYPRFPIYTFLAQPRPVAVETDLAIEPVAPNAGAIAAVRAIDDSILGFSRDAVHEFLMSRRPVFLHRRGDRVVGYGYVGGGAGPIALLDADDFPAVLAHGEAQAAARGEEVLRFNVPLVNRAAVSHLLGRGFRLEDFLMHFMCDEPFGSFDRYISTSPALFL